MDKSMIVSDYDGTFHRHDLDELIKNVELSKIWRKQGNLFVFNTGRDVDVMKLEKDKHDIEFDYIIALNGAFVVDSNYNIIFKKVIHTSLAKEIVAYMRNKVDDQILVQNGFNGCYQVNAVPGNEKIEYIRKRNEKLYKYNIEEALELEIISIGCLAKDFETAKSIHMNVSKKYADKVDSYLNLNYVNIVSKGISKASGLEAVIRDSGIDKKKVYTIGDNFNDIPMFRGYESYAMYTAKEEVRLEATGVISNVYHLIEDKVKYIKGDM